MNEAFEPADLLWLWVLLHMTFVSPLSLLVVVTREIHPKDISRALTHETLDAHQRVLKEELIHMLLIPIIEVSHMVLYTLDLTSPSGQT